MTPLQGSLAELKLEVAAARQLSSQVTASLPKNSAAFLDVYQHGQSWTPLQSTKAISSVHASPCEQRQAMPQMPGEPLSARNQCVMQLGIAPCVKGFACYVIVR